MLSLSTQIDCNLRSQIKVWFNDFLFIIERDHLARDPISTGEVSETQNTSRGVTSQEQGVTVQQSFELATLTMKTRRASE